MSIAVTCEACGGELHLNDRLAGRRVRCQHCDAVIQVPKTQPAEIAAAVVSDNGAVSAEAVHQDEANVETIEATETEALEPTGSDRVEFAHDPVFDSPGHHHATDMPTLPPSMQAEEGDDDPPKRTKRKEDELDMTPMVDVTFLLLIFFMVTAAFSLQKSLEVPPPDQREGAAEAPTIEEVQQDDDYVIIRIDADNSVWVNDTEAPSEQEVLVKLREARQGEFGGAGPSGLLVLADGDCHHETVVMVLDIGNAVGMEHIRLATVDEEVF